MNDLALLPLLMTIGMSLNDFTETLQMVRLFLVIALISVIFSCFSRDLGNVFQTVVYVISVVVSTVSILYVRIRCSLS